MEWPAFLFCVCVLWCFSKWVKVTNFHIESTEVITKECVGGGEYMARVKSRNHSHSGPFFIHEHTFPEMFMSSKEIIHLEKSHMWLKQ